MNSLKQAKMKKCITSFTGPESHPDMQYTSWIEKSPVARDVETLSEINDVFPPLKARFGRKKLVDLLM